MTSESDSVGNGIGGNRGFPLGSDGLIAVVDTAVESSGCKLMDRPSSVDNDILGRSSPWSYLSGTGGGGLDDNEVREGDVDPLVLTLNLEGNG